MQRAVSSFAHLSQSLWFTCAAAFLVWFWQFLSVRDGGRRGRVYVCVYLGGEYCPVAKRKAEVAWQEMVLSGSSFLGRAGVCLC